MTGHPPMAAMAGRIVERAPAKINLTLHVLGRRADGYHELESIVAFADLGEEVTFEPAAETSLVMEGPFCDGLSVDDNLVRAAHRACGSSAPPLAMCLRKEIPVAAGLGGGSADAAAVLRVLSGAGCAPRSASALAGLGRSLGADVPVCLTSRAAFMAGSGENVTPTAAPPFHAILVNPRIAVSTAAVFASLGLAPGERTGRPARAPTLESSRKVADAVLGGGNDLQAPARRAAPIVDAVMDAVSGLPDCRVARMTGSGATCFGLFDTAAGAALAAERLRSAEPGWWVRKAALF